MMRKTLTTTRALIPLVFSLVLTLVFTIRAEPAAAELRLLAAELPPYSYRVPSGSITETPGPGRGTVFEAVNPRAECPYMKLITPEKLEACLGEPELTRAYEVDVAPDVAAAARRAVERMIAIGQPGGGE